MPPAPEPRPGKPPLFTAPFVFTCLANFAFFLSHQLALLAMPLYALHLGGTEADAGTVTTLFTLAALLARLPIGWVMDRWGRRPVLVAGMALGAACALFYPALGSVGGLFALRPFHGIALGIFSSAAGAVATDVVPAPRRGEGLGYFGSTSNVALAVGPMLSLGIVQRYGFLPLFLLAAGVAVMGAGLGAAVRETGTRIDSPAPLRLTTIFVRSAVFPGIVMGALTVTHGALVTFLPLMGQARALGNPGIFYTVAALVLVAVRAQAGALSDRWGRGPVIVPGMLVAAVAMAVVGLAHRQATLVAAGALWGLGFGMAAPALMALVGDRASETDRARAISTFYGGWELGIGLGAYPLGYLLTYTNFTVMYAAAGLITAAGGFGFLLWNRPGPRARR